MSAARRSRALAALSALLLLLGSAGTRAVTATYESVTRKKPAKKTGKGAKATGASTKPSTSTSTSTKPSTSTSTSTSTKPSTERRAPGAEHRAPSAERRAPATKAAKGKPAPPPARAAASPAPPPTPEVPPVVVAPVAAPAPPPAPIGPRALGTVVQVTVARAFLDAGAREGLRLGLAVELHRGPNLVGLCAIDRVADHTSSCTGVAARAGDLFALGPPPASPKVDELPPIPGPLEQSRRKRALEAALLYGVEFNAPASALQPAPRIFLRAAQLVWAATDASAWEGQRLDVRVLGLPITDGKGRLPATDLTLDVTLLHLSRPDLGVYRPGADVQLFVWEAALASHPREGTSFAFGRVLPWYAPGATRLDGVQLGQRFTPNIELGVFGGGVPDPATLEPTFSRATAGAYWSLDHTGAQSELFPYASTTGRLAWVTSPEAGTRFELESSSIAQLKKAGSLAASLRFGLGDNMGPGALDAARVSFDLHPTERLAFNGSFRYSGAELLEDTALVVASGPSHHLDLAASWEARHALVLGLEGGVAQDDTANASFGRRWVGPTAAMPQFFGSLGGLSVGAHVEGGDLPGYSGWVGATLSPGKSVQLLIRATAQLDSRTEGRDVTTGLYGSVRAQLMAHLALQCTLLARMQPVALGSVPPDLMGGLFADLGVRGEF